MLRYVVIGMKRSRFGFNDDGWNWEKRVDYCSIVAIAFEKSVFVEANFRALQMSLLN